MMKNYILLILLFSKIFVHSESLNEKCTGAPSSAIECIDKFTNEERDAGYYCCLIKSRKMGVETSWCSLLTKEDYDNLGNYMEDLIDFGFKYPSVICGPSSSSHYLQLRIISLLLILLYC